MQALLAVSIQTKRFHWRVSGRADSIMRIQAWMIPKMLMDIFSAGQS
jgi:hypothetical protein